MPSHRFLVAENVREEITDPAQSESVQAAIDSGMLPVVSVDDTREIGIYAELRRVLGDGEAASLAIAQHRGWGFVSYEGRKLAREALGRLGSARFLRTPEVLAWAVQTGSVELRTLRGAIAHLGSSEVKNPTETSVEHLTTLVDQAERLTET